MTVQVHTRPNCGQCDLTKMKLRRNGIPYTEVELTEESVNRFKKVGHMSAPIVIAGQHTWAGFRPDLIDAYTATLNKDTTSKGEDPE